MRASMHLVLAAYFVLPWCACATLYHTAATHNLISAIAVNSTLVADETALAARVSADRTATMYVNLFDPIPGAWTSAPIALMAVCVVNSLPSTGVLTTVPKLAAALAGTPTSSVFVALDGPRFDASDVVFVLPRTTTAMTVVMKEFVRRRLAGFTTHTEYPPAVRANPRIVWVDSDGDVSAAVLAAPNRIGFAATSQSGALQRAKIVVNVNDIRDRVTGPALRSTSANDYKVSLTGLTAVPTTHEAAYPFVGAVLLNLKSPFACSKELFALQAIVRVIATSLKGSPVYAQADVVGLNAEQLEDAVMLIRGHVGHCPAVKNGNVVGEAAVARVMQHWSVARFVDTNEMIGYTAADSDEAIQAVAEHQVNFAISDRGLTANERAATPSLQLVPAIAFAVAIVVNAPGFSNFNIPECTLLRMLTGGLVYWDDPTLVAANPSATIPHVPIKVVALSTPSGDTYALTHGLSNIAHTCPNTPEVEASHSWSLKADFSQSSLDSAMHTVKVTPWTIGYGDTHAAIEFHATQVTILEGDVAVTTDAAYTLATLRGATIDAATAHASFQHAPGMYPFVDVLYYVFHDAYPNNCDAVKRDLDFMRWALTDAYARELSSDTGYVPLLLPTAQAMWERIGDVRCAGAFLYPKPETSSFPLWVIGVVVAAAVLWIAAMVLYTTVRKKGAVGRDNANAPKEGPVTIVFADIQSSTRLWSNCPASMSYAVEAHHQIVRAAVAKHKAYEVKTIDDCFMIAAKRLDDAVAVVMEIQETLQNTMVPQAILDVYASDEAFVDVDDDPEYLASIEPTWNGLRIKVGVHTGHPEIKFDEVTKGYDYYGHDTNVAARVMSVARGGQVLCTEATAEMVAGKYKLVEMGGVELKGVSGKTNLTSLAIPSLPGRVFAPLLRQETEVGGESSVSNAESTGDDLLETIEQFAFVRDGTMSAQSVEGEVFQMADSIEHLFSTTKATVRTGTANMLRRAWRISSELDTDELYLRLALKVFPMHVARSTGRRASAVRRSTLGNHLAAKESPLQHSDAATE